MTGELLQLLMFIIVWSTVFLCAMFSMFENMDERIKKLEWELQE